MNPQGLNSLLDLASDLLNRSDVRMAPLWPRAAALLVRQALEEALDQYWRGRGTPALAALPTAPQLACLREYLGDAVIAAQVSHAWSALTRSCHHHVYEVAPNHSELTQHLDAVRNFCAMTQGQVA